MAKAPRSRPVFGRLYPRMNQAMERAGGTGHRKRLLAGLSGEVVDVGAGDGSAFRHYPRDVTKLTAVEPEPHLRKLALAHAEDAPVPVSVLAAASEELPFPDGSFDAAVVSLVLCSVHDQEVVLRELLRVLRPGGQLRFFEHVRAEGRRLRRVQRVVDATVGPTLSGGCHSGRATVSAIENAGFRIEEIDRFQFPETRVPLPASQHVLGTAVTPA